MSLLLDRILAFGVQTNGLGAPSPSDFERFTVLSAQNAADYFYLGTPQEVWHKRDDFGCVLPPWIQTWVEWRQPHASNSNGKLIPLPGRRMYGFAIEQRDVNDPSLFQVGRDPQAQRFEAAVEEACKWLLAVGIFIEDGHIRVGPRLLIYLGLDEDGRVAEWPRKYGGVAGEILMTTAIPPAAQDPKIEVAVASTLMNPTLFALSLLHCKNVKTEEIRPPAALNHAHVKRSGRNLLRYHILDVEPFKRVAESSGGGATGIKRALHICRGHKATYTSAAPLFGKYVGEFWIPQHTRGSIAYGAVSKDYRLVGVKDA